LPRADTARTWAPLWTRCLSRGWSLASAANIRDVHTLPNGRAPGIEPGGHHHRGWRPAPAPPTGAASATTLCWHYNQKLTESPKMTCFIDQYTEIVRETCHSDGSPPREQRPACRS
jgi:hypothetical protein